MTEESLTLRITAQTDEFVKSLKDIKDRCSVISKEVQEIDKQLKTDSADRAAKLAEKISLVERQSALAAKEAQEYGAKIKQLNEVQTESAEEQEKVNKKINDLTEKMALAIHKSETFTSQASDLRKELEEAQQSTEDLTEEIGNLSKNEDQGTKDTKNFSGEIKDVKKDSNEAKSGINELAKGIVTNLCSSAIKSGLNALKSGITSIGTTCKNVASAAINAFKNIASSVFSAVKNVAGAVKDFVSGGMELAEEYAQTESKVGQVFGDSAQEIIDWSKSAVDSFGLTSGEAQAAAATFGNMYAAMGVSEKEAADMSMGMVQLAADIGAFNNADTSEVLEAMSSMLAGNTQGMRKYGIVITEAEVKERALADSTKTTADELTNAELAAARFALMEEQAAKQSGQFARESGSVGVQTQMRTARIKELQASIAKGLLPVQEKLLNLTNSLINNPAVIAIFDKIVTKVAEVGESLTDLLDGIDLTDLEGGFSDILSQITGKIVEFIPQIIEFGGTILTGLLEGINKYLPLIIGSAAMIIGELMAALITNLPTLIDGAAQILTTLLEGIITYLPMLVTGAELLLTTLIDGISANVNTIAESASTIIMSLLNFIIDNLPQLAVAAFQIILKIASEIAKNLPELAHSAIKMVGEIVRGIADHWEEIKQAGVDIVVGLIAGLTSMLITLGIEVVKLWQTIKEKFNIADIFEIGANILKGLWEGMKSASTWLWDEVSGLFSGIVDGVKGLFGIASPSKEFAEIGRFMALGLEVGFDDTIGKVEDDITGRLKRGLTPEGTAFQVKTGLNPTGGFGASGVNTINTTNNNYQRGDLIVYVSSYGADAASIADEIGAEVNRKLRMAGAW